MQSRWDRCRWWRGRPGRDLRLLRVDYEDCSVRRRRLGSCGGSRLRILAGLHEPRIGEGTDRPVNGGLHSRWPTSSHFYHPGSRNGATDQRGLPGGIPIRRKNQAAPTPPLDADKPPVSAIVHSAEQSSQDSSPTILKSKQAE